MKIIPKGCPNVNYLNMIQKCFQENVVCRHMQNCFYFWPDEPPMETKINIDCVRILIIGMYLQALVELCKRHLHKGFIRVQENLTSKIKGKILIKDNILSNTLHGRPDRIFCQYQRHDLDNRENQVLMAALHQCQKEMRRNVEIIKGTALQEWARISNNALGGVTLRRIHPSEFQALQLGGMKKVYKKPLQLAKWILKLFGTDPNQPLQNDQQQTIIPPFAIDMNELFERYCEVRLRKDWSRLQSIWAGYMNNNLNTNGFAIRPDFIVKDEKYGWIVLDAKYKYGWNEKYRDDVFQVITYCRHEKIKTTEEDNYPSSAIILSPSNNDQSNDNNSTIQVSSNSRILTSAFKNPELHHITIN